MRFSWEKPPDGKVWIWVRVEERLKPEVAGPILASAGPEGFEYGDKLSMSMDTVPNGDNRIIVVEVREGASKGLPILYYGLSEPFALASGKTVVVDVPLMLKVPEAQAQKAEVSLLFHSNEAEAVGLADIKDATVQASFDNAVSVVLAADESFAAGLRTYALETGEGIECSSKPEGDKNWTVCAIEGWDLTGGLEAPSDKVYSVYVKFLDRYGYESQVRKASALLDTQAPMVMAASLSPPVAGADQPVLLSATFHEPLGKSPDGDLLAELSASPVGGTSAPPLDFGKPFQVGQSNSYFWKAQVEEQEQDSAEYQFKLVVQDEVGNSDTYEPLADNDHTSVILAVDARPPVLVLEPPVQYSETLFGIENVDNPEKNKFSFDFVVKEANAHSLADGSGACAGLCPQVRIGTALMDEGIVFDSEGSDQKSGQYLFSFNYQVHSADWGTTDKVHEVAILWSDQAGNTMEAVLPETVRFDFVRPACSHAVVAPEFGNAGSTFTYTITAVEPLSQVPILEVTSTNPVMFADEPEESGGGHTYTWTQSAAGLADESFAVEALLTDLAGNDSGGYVCKVSGTVDGIAPGIEDGIVATDPEVLNAEEKAIVTVGDGGRIVADFQVGGEEELAEGFPSVQLVIPQESLVFDLVDEQPEDGGTVHYTYDLEMKDDQHDFAEGAWPVRVVVQDKAGNQGVVAALGGGLVRVDFTPPQAECNLVPNLGDIPAGIGTKLTLQVWPLEELETGTVPVLEEAFEPATEQPFFTYQSGPGYAFSGTIEEGSGEHSFDVRFLARDLVGNETPQGGNACIGGELSGVVDGERPSVTEVLVTVLSEEYDNASNLPLKAGLVVAATVTLSGTQVEPSVFLGSGEMSPENDGPDPVGDDGYQWLFQRTLDGSEGEGTQYVSILGVDEAGNTYEYVENDSPLSLDFTIPEANCLVNLDSAKAGDVLRITATFSEALSDPGPIVESSLDFAFKEEPSDPEAKSPKYVFEHIVSGDTEEDHWDYSMTASDLAGNPDEATVLCSGGGTLDAVVPEVSDAEVATEPKVQNGDNALVLAVGDTDIIVATLTVSEDKEIAQGYPQLFLDVAGSPIPFQQDFMSQVGQGNWEYVFHLTMNKIIHAQDEGVWPVRAVAQDQAGNLAVVNKLAGELVTVDFTPPDANCTLIPDVGDSGAFPIGQKVIVQVSPFEELHPDHPPELQQEFVPPLDGDFFKFESETSYRFSGIVPDSGANHDFAVTVLLTDLVGNATDPSDPEQGCAGGPVTGTMDARTPNVLGSQLEPTGKPLNVGKTVTASIQLDDTQVKPTVFLGKGLMEALVEVPEELDDTTYQWVFQRTLQGDEGEGQQGLTISGVDEAGNPYDHAEPEPSATLDFTDPTAQCLVNLDPAKLGETVTLTVSFSEPVLNVELSTDSVCMLEFDEDASLPEQNQPQYVYSYEVEPEDVSTSWECLASAIDLAGNPHEPEELCAGGGSIDATPISIVEWDVWAEHLAPNSSDIWIPTGLYATDKSRVTIEFTVNEEPADGALEVRVGQELVTDSTQDNLSYSFIYTADGAGKEGQEVKPVTISLSDQAGNETIETPAVVTFDYDVPSVAGIPYFERCDGYPDARLDQNDIWVKKQYDCAYSVHPDDCAELGAPLTGTVQVSFALTENVLEDKRTIQVAGHDLQIVPCSSSGNYIVAFYTPSGDEEETAECSPVIAQVEDLAGNQAELVLGCFRFDFTAPAVPDTVSSDGIVYTRIPWGAHATGGAKTFLLEGKEGTVEPYARITVYDDAEVDKAAEIGKTLADEDGAFGGPLGSDTEFKLVPADRSTVFVTTTDPAGNESDADQETPGVDGLPVSHVVWLVTMGYKNAGSSLDNPHVFERVRVLQETIAQHDGVEAGASNGLADWEGDSVTTSGAASWKAIPPLEHAPPERNELAMAYDSARGRVVLFGGKAGYISVYEDTWEWDGLRWTQPPLQDPEGDGNPIGRALHSMVYDKVLGRVFMFGGSGAIEDDAQWEWDGVSWNKVLAGGLGEDGVPSRRWLHAMAYDDHRGVVVLHGGMASECELGNDGICDFTWEKRGNFWRKVEMADPEGDGNPHVWKHAMVYDPERRRVVLFGGNSIEGEDSVKMEDTWEYDGVSWKRVIPADPEGDGNPAGRVGHSLAYSAAQGKVLLMGGMSDSSCGEGTGVNCRYVWEWNGVSWKHRIPAVAWNAAPPPVNVGGARHGTVYAAAWDRTVVFGGGKHTWEFDGRYWDKLTPIKLAGQDEWPRVRHSESMVWDSERGIVVMYGGHNPDGCLEGEGVKCADTWEWDGRAWYRVPIEDPEGDGEPPPRSGQAMAFDPGRGKVVMFGGGDEEYNCFGDVWEFDGISWDKIEPADPEGDGNPCARTGHAMTFNALSGHVFLTAGYVYSSNCYGSSSSYCWDTWEWDGASWMRVYSNDPEEDGDPAHRAWHCSAFDLSRQAVVDFGGWYMPVGNQETFSNLLWEWNGQSWAQLSGSWPVEGPGPAGRSGSAMVFDEQGNDVLIAAGLGGISLDDVWSWNGSDWTEIEVADSEGDGGPTPGELHSMAYDGDSLRTVLFGGNSVFGNSTWILDRGYETRPAHIIRVAFSALGDLNPPIVKSIRTTWRTGGARYVADAPENPGATLSVWDRGGWEEIGATAATAKAPQTIEWATSDPVAVRRLLFGSPRSVTFAVTPKASNGPGRAEITTDYVEVEVRYHRPLPTELYCTDGLDGDLDGLADCEDEDCIAAPECEAGAEFTCGDGFDNDSDGATDCEDLDCWCSDACGLTEKGCCFYSVLRWCEGGVLEVEDCASNPTPNTTCGWSEQLEAYACGGDGADPGGALSPTCPGSCQPQCDGKECGWDGCGGGCGYCPEGSVCFDDHCQCEPECADKECGDDGCGGSCGECEVYEECFDGMCVFDPTAPCNPNDFEPFCDGTIYTTCDEVTQKPAMANCLAYGGTACQYIPKFDQDYCIGTGELGDSCYGGAECNWSTMDLCLNMNGTKYCSRNCYHKYHCPADFSCCVLLTSGKYACAGKNEVPSQYWQSYCY
jgi:hypothetical protein